MKEKVILAYSGGLDTTAIIPWLKENYFPADQKLLSAAGRYGQTTAERLWFGTIVTGEQFIVDEKGTRLIRNTCPFRLTWKRRPPRTSAM